LVWLDYFRDTLKGSGLDTLMRDDEFYGVALALGDVNLPLMSLTNAYRPGKRVGSVSNVRPDAIHPGVRGGGNSLRQRSVVDFQLSSGNLFL
jgi:hypothetical protein